VSWQEEKRRQRARYAREKCRSPTLNLAPGTWTGRNTLLPRERFLMSQFPPCSGLPGIVLAPSRPTFSLMLPSPLPTCTLCGLGGSATTRSICEQDWISSPSRLFHSARISGEGAQPKIPGWIKPAKRTPGMLVTYQLSFLRAWFSWRTRGEKRTVWKSRISLRSPK
jgi:hypothetical protein